MDNYNHQDELEEFLLDEVNDHRMYPSDKIWRNIQNEVHGPQSWPALTFISLFIISALTVTTLINNHPNQQSAKLIVLKTGGSNKLASNHAISNTAFGAISAEQVTASTIAQIEQQQISAPASPLTEETPVIPMHFVKEDVQTIMAENILKEKELPTKPSFLVEAKNYNSPIESSSVEKSDLNANLLEDNSELNKTEETQETISTISNTNSIQKAPLNFKSDNKNSDANSIDEYLKEFAYKPVTTVSARNSKFGFGFFITPSTSYRRLSDMKAKEILGAAPVTAPVGLNYTTNINEIVRHKPAVGLELGFAVLYNMTNRLKFKTGVQFNIRQYYIETFQSVADVTTISLVNNYGVENVNVLSLYNNNTGYRNAELDNKMYQVSIPIGFQYDVIKGKHIGITAEASIQPTFTLNKSLYLLSTDYKHYADGNSLMRKWNINSSLGINLTYQTGVYQWFVGPQARFQHLPTYSNKYPITEYLMDYGIRLGFIKQIK